MFPSWKRSITPSKKRVDLNQHNCWLVFVDRAGLGSSLVQTTQTKWGYGDSSQDW